MFAALTANATNPSKLISCSARANRSKSPISAHSPTAVSVSIPRRHRNLATVCAHGARQRELGEVGLDLIAAGDQDVVGVQVVGQCRLRGMIGEPDRGQPRAVLARPRLTRALPVDLAAQAGSSRSDAARGPGRSGCPRGSGPDRAAAHAPQTGS